MILRCYRSTLDGRLMPFAEQSNNTQMISNHALHGGCRHECSIARPPPLYIWSSGNNGSINDDVEWGFPFKRRHCPNLTTQVLFVFSLLTLNTHCPLEQSTISRPVCWPHSLDTPPLVGQWHSHPQTHAHSRSPCINSTKHLYPDSYFTDSSHLL
jgi:hypothetical protein